MTIPGKSMRRLMRRRASVAGATLALATGTILVSLGTAPPVYAATQEELCTDFTASQQWSTATTWGRVSEQVCIVTTDTDIAMRSRVRFDWPVPCSLTVGWPKAINSVSCPVSVIAKDPTLEFRVNEAGYSALFPMRMTSPTGSSWTRQCTSTTAFSVSSAIAQGASRIYQTCTGSWHPRTPGRYVVAVEGIRYDVKNDGRGLRILDSHAQGFNVT